MKEFTETQVRKLEDIQGADRLEQEKLYKRNEDSVLDASAVQRAGLHFSDGQVAAIEKETNLEERTTDYEILNAPQPLRHHTDFKSLLSAVRWIKTSRYDTPRTTVEEELDRLRANPDVSFEEPLAETLSAPWTPDELVGSKLAPHMGEFGFHEDRYVNIRNSNYEKRVEEGSYYFIYFSDSDSPSGNMYAIGKLIEKPETGGMSEGQVKIGDVRADIKGFQIAAYIPNIAMRFGDADSFL